MDASVMDTTGDDPPKSSPATTPDGDMDTEEDKVFVSALSDLEPLITLVKSVKHTADIPGAVEAIVERNVPADDLMTAVYIVAKSLYYAWVKTSKDDRSTVAKHAALSDLVSRLLEINKLDLDTIARVMDHETRCVLQFSCNTNNNNDNTAIGLDKINDTLSLASPPANVAPEVLATLVTYFISVYSLDPAVVVEKVLFAAADDIAYPTMRATHIPGGFDGNQMDDPYALIFHNIRLSAGAREILQTFDLELVKSSAMNVLADKSAEKEEIILPADRRVLLGYALIRDATLPVEEVLKLFEDKKTRDEAWKKYTDKAAELADNGSYITKPRELKRNRPSPTHDCWKTTPSDRDIFLLENFLDVGPWHECGAETLPLLELELLVLFIRCCRWKEAMEIFKYIEASNTDDVDFVAHPPVAKALSNLALAMLQGLLSEYFEFQYPSAKKRFEAMSSLDESFVSPVEKHNHLFENGGGVFGEILFKLGSHCRRNPALIFGVIRLIQDEDIGEENTMVSKYLQYVLLPALQLTTANSALSLSIWKIIREAPHTVRWDMYRYCQIELPKRNAQIAVSNAQATYETRSVMKRVTIDTADIFQRTMAKISTGQGLSLGTAFIRRVQGYAPDKKTLEPFVQILSKATPLSLDMLMYLVVEALGNDSKEKMKSDGTNFEMWFAATSLLAGIFLRKARIESCSFDGMLTFLKQRIVDNGDPAYVEVLKDIVLCVTEIDIPRSLTTRQQKARAGGKHIRDAVQGCLDKVTEKSAPGTVIDTYLEKECRKASLALKKSLMYTDTHYELAMGIAKCASVEGGAGTTLPVKAGSGRRDRLRGALYQFVEMIDTLNRMEQPQQRGEVKREKNDGMWARFRKTNLEELKLSNFQPTDYFGIVRPILDYREGLPIVEEWAEERAKTAQYKAELARSFWTLDLADLYVPEKLYESEALRFKRCISHWESFLDSRQGARMKSAQRYKADKEVERFVSVRKKLGEELNDGKAREKYISKELSGRAKDFGSGIMEEPQKKRMEVMQEFATQCIIPRARATGADAMFCVRFMFGINKINKGGALDMPELIKYLIQSTQTILEEATECDADNFALLIAELLTMMDAWRSNRKAFDGDVDRHGFKSSDGTIWRHEVYCNYAFELHRTLTEGCENLLKSTEYLHTRNGLTLLHLVAEVFPKVREHATTIMEGVEKVTKSEKEDLKLSATRVLGTLKNGEAKRVPVHIFKLKLRKSTENNSESSRGVKREREEQSRQDNNNGNNNHPAKRVKSPKSPASPAKKSTNNNPKRQRTPEDANNVPSKRPRSDKREEEDGGRGPRQQQKRGSGNNNDKRRHSHEGRDARDGGGRGGRRDVEKDGGGRDGRRDGDRDGRRDGPREGARDGRREAGRSAAGDGRRGGRDGGGGGGGGGGREADRDSSSRDGRRDGSRDGDGGGREGGRPSSGHNDRGAGRDGGARDGPRDSGPRHGRVTDRLGRVGGGREPRERMTPARENMRFRDDGGRRPPWNQDRQQRSPPRRNDDDRFEDENRRRNNNMRPARLDEPLRPRDERHERNERMGGNERNDRNQGRRNNIDHRNRGWNDNQNPEYDDRFDGGYDHRRQQPPRRRRGGPDHRRR